LNSAASSAFWRTAAAFATSLWAVAGITALAGLLRFSFPDIVEYFHDDAMVTTLAQEMIAQRHLPTTGILSSTGIPNPPATIYALALPFALSSDPALAILFIMALNTVGVGIFALLARQIAGPAAGNLAALLYAISPWAVWYSRKIWAQDYHTPFLLAGLLLGYYGFATQRQRWWAQAGCLPVLLFAMQIHFAAWALLPLYGLLLWHGRRTLNWRALGASAVLSLVVIAPYVVGLSDTLARDPQRITSALSRSGSTTNPSVLLQSLWESLILAAGGIDPLRANDAQWMPFPWLLTSLPIAIGMVYGVWSLWRRHNLRWFVLWWAFGPGLLLVVPVIPVYPHYFVASIPALLLVAATGMIALWQKFQPHRLAAIGIAAVVGVHVTHWYVVLDNVDRTPYQYPAFTTPLRYLQPVRDYLSNSEDVIVISQGMAWDINHEVAVWETLLRNRVACVRTLRDGYILYPAQRFTVLVTPDGAGSELAGMAAAVGAAKHFAARGAEAYIAYDGGWVQQPYTAIAPAHYDNGATLLGYRLQASGVTLVWALQGSMPRGHDYQYTVQALGENDALLAQHDSRFLQGMHWCANDILEISVPLALPPETRALRVGLYRLGYHPGTYTNAQVVGPQGLPEGPYTLIPLAQS
jgi:hypothetical protein